MGGFFTARPRMGGRRAEGQWRRGGPLGLIVFIYSNGRKLGLQRSIKSNWEALDHYGRVVATPALVAFQKRHGVKLTLLDVEGAVRFGSGMGGRIPFPHTHQVLHIGALVC